MAAVLFRSLFFIVIVTIGTISGLKEVCQWETFEAKCQDDEVIKITEAHYGRMGIGRCQPRDFGFAGCSADVSANMHARCSGRQHCSVPIPDPVMFAATPCPKDLVTYLQADYECIKVAKHSTDNCDDQILTAVGGDIAKPLTTTNSYVCPQRILAQPGQTVNVYLYDFYNKDSITETKPECISYGFVSEDGNPPTKICGGEFRKNHLIYSSDSHIVDIMVTEASSHSHHYILHYEIIGCPTPQAPKYGWVKVQDNTAVVMCNFSHIASELVCSGNEWVGDVQNCTSFHADQSGHSLSLSSFKNVLTNSPIFVVIIISLICGVLCMVGLLAIVKVFRSNTKQMSDQPQSQMSLLEKPPLPQNEKSFKTVDEYQPVYVPITIDNHDHYAPVHQHNLFEVPRSNALSTIYASRTPLVENIYGSVSNSHVNNSTSQIYNITGLHLNRDNVINMHNTILN